jgi:hypothetical protein
MKPLFAEMQRLFPQPLPGLQVFDKRGGFVLKEAYNSSQYHKERNTLQVKLVRQGLKLLVYFNGELVKELANAMGPDIRWIFLALA